MGCDDYGIFMNSIYIYMSYFVEYSFREPFLSLLIHISPTLYVETSCDIVGLFHWYISGYQTD